ncbi:MAG: 2'-5' RNA ligase family protein [Bacteroidota bacterium]
MLRMNGENNLFGDRLVPTEYLLIIHPSERTAQKVSQLKQRLWEMFGAFPSGRSMAHISLVNFFLDMNREEKIIEGIERVVNGHKPFEVRLRDFDQFPDSKTIFINVIDQEPVRNLTLDLVTYFRLNYVTGKYLHATLTPHMTVARKLEELQFQMASEILEGQEFRDAFLVDKVVLLKRIDGKLKEYKTFHIE